MSSSSWLPPLNAHTSYSMVITATEIINSDNTINKSELIPIAFTHKNPGVRLYIDTEVNFYPTENEGEGPFQGLSIARKYFRYYSQLISSAHSKDTIVPLFEDMRSMINFEYDRVVFSEKPLDRDEYCIVDDSIEDLDGLIGRFTEFIECVKEKPYNKDKILFHIKLNIDKYVMIPPEEYQAWVNWYDEKKQVDRLFEKNYKRAISRPRRIEEMIYDTTLTFRPASGSRIERALEGFWNDEKERECSICLGGILIGTKCSRLQCKHAFHVKCITRWLSQSRVCPVCRFSV